MRGQFTWRGALLIAIAVIGTLGLLLTAGAFALDYTPYLTIAPSASSDGCTQYGINQTFVADGSAAIAIVTYKEGSTGSSGGRLTLGIWNSSGLLGAGSPVSYGNAGAKKNATFSTPVNLQNDGAYTLQWLPDGGDTGVKCLQMDTANPYADGQAQRLEGGWDAGTFDIYAVLWTPISDAVPPTVALACSKDWANITAGDNVGLSGLWLFSGTPSWPTLEAYNGTPYNNSRWAVGLDLSAGNYTFAAVASDTSGNNATSANCTVTVSSTTSTTTTAPAGNGSAVTVVVAPAGFGWLVVFFILLCVFVFFGGLRQ